MRLGHGEGKGCLPGPVDILLILSMIRCLNKAVQAMSNPLKNGANAGLMKTKHLIKWIAVFALAVTVARAQTPPAAASSVEAQAQPSGPANLSPGAAEVIRLAGSGVGDDVVAAYIQNSQAPFNLSADDVLYLKDIGLSRR